MPGGGLYRRVANGLNAAAVGPEALLSKSNPDKLKDGANSPKSDILQPEEEEEDVCDVRAFSVWYWSEEGSFEPETMYLNAKDVGKTPGEPRLIVSLSSFEALSQAYVMAIEKEGIKAALLQEREDLLAAARIGYHKELLHLRELLGMAQEQMRLARQNRLEDAEQQRKEEFERTVRETDVHYFNLVDYLEPELKGIVKDAVKQFNRDLMRENFDLRDRLALHEGTQDEAGAPERLATLLLSKGHSPAQIVKMLHSMIGDKKQSDEFLDTVRQMLGLPKKERQGIDNDSADREAEREAKERELTAAREKFEKQKAEQEKAAKEKAEKEKLEAEEKAKAEAEAAAGRRRAQMQQSDEPKVDVAAAVAAGVAEAMGKAQGEFMKQIKEKEDKVGAVSGENNKLKEELEKVNWQMKKLEEKAQAAEKAAEKAAAAAAAKTPAVQAAPAKEPKAAKAPKKQQIIEEEESEEEPAPEVIIVKKKKPPKPKPPPVYVEESDEEPPTPPAEVIKVKKKKKEPSVALSSESEAPAADPGADPAELAAAQEALQAERAKVEAAEKQREAAQKAKEAAEKKAAEAERQKRELEEQLRAAKAMVAKMNVQPMAEEPVKGPPPREPSPAASLSEAAAASEVMQVIKQPSDKEESLAGTVQGSLEPSPRESSYHAPSENLDSTLEVAANLSARGSMSRSQLRKTLALDRSFENAEEMRSGKYAQNGKPVAMVEAELDRERATRVKVAAEAVRLSEEVDSLEEERDRLTAEVASMRTQLEETASKLENLAEAPIVDVSETEGLDDVAMFCKWLTRRYGSVENGFRALDTDKNSSMCATEFVSGLETMGWVKVVGKRLFKVIDPENTGRISLEQLLEVQKRESEFSPHDSEEMHELNFGSTGPMTSLANGSSSANLAASLGNSRASMARRSTAKGALTSGVADAAVEAMRARLRELEHDKKDLQEQFEAEQKRAAKLETKLAEKPKEDTTKLKAAERKVESIKVGFDNMKVERDELTSKMTAAMWKCREAHILQVKYMRETEVANEELRKAQDKLELFKNTYRMQRAADGLSVAGRRTTIAGTPLGMSWPGPVAAAATPGHLVEDTPEGLSRQITPPGSADVAAAEATAPEAQTPARDSTPDRRLGSASNLRCPRCNTPLRMEQPPGSPLAVRPARVLRKSLSDFSGDEPAGLFGDNQDDEARPPAVSAEEMIANMTDDELLFGRPLTAVSETDQLNERRATVVSTAGLSQAQKMGASYREKSESINAAGSKRWQLLYADSEDRQRQPPSADTAVPSLLTQDSQDLIAHARQVRGSIWKEAVPINELSSTLELGSDAAGERAADERGAGAPRFSVAPSKNPGKQGVKLPTESSSEAFQGEASLRQAGVGGSPASRGNVRGSVHLGRPSLPVGGQATAQATAQAIAQATAQSFSQATAQATAQATVQFTEQAQSSRADPKQSSSALNRADSKQSSSALNQMMQSNAQSSRADPKQSSSALNQMKQSNASLLQMLGQDPLSPTTLQLGGSRKKERTPSPDAERSMPSQRRAPQERVPKRVPSRSPDHSPTLDTRDPILIVRNKGADASGGFDSLSESISQALSLSGSAREPRASAQPRPLAGSRSKSAVRRDSRDLADVSFPMDDLEIGGTSWNSMPSKHDPKLRGMWNRSMNSRTPSTAGDSDLKAAIQADLGLGSGLPQHTPDRPSHRKPGGLKHHVSSTTQLPSLSVTSDGRLNSKKQAQHAPMSINMSASMPDLNSHFALPLLSDRGAAHVKTPPLAGQELALISPKQQKRHKKSASEKVAEARAGADGSTPPFEAPLLYVGKPPPAAESGAASLSGSWKGSHSMGASHTIPAPLRKQLMMAANAFELGDHVQRHARVDETAAELGVPPVVHRSLVPATSPVAVLS